MKTQFSHQNRSILPRKIGKLSTSFNDRGFGIIETIISIGLAVILLIGFTTLILQIIKTSQVNTSELKAMMYLQELIEISKDLEQSGWDELINPPCAAPLICHPEATLNTWTFTSGAESLDNGTYTRSLTIESVSRNQNTFPNEIVSNGGIDDPNTKKIIATIMWYDGLQTRNLMLETYVYNYTP